MRKKDKVLEYNVIFTPEVEGGYSVYAPDLPGCVSQGETFEEAQKNIQEAIELYLEEVDGELYQAASEQSQQQFMAKVKVHV